MFFVNYVCLLFLGQVEFELLLAGDDAHVRENTFKFDVSEVDNDDADQKLRCRTARPLTLRGYCAAHCIALVL